MDASWAPATLRILVSCAGDAPYMSSKRLGSAAAPPTEDEEDAPCLILARSAGEAPNMLANAAGLGERYTAGDAGYVEGDVCVAAWSCAARSLARSAGDAAHISWKVGVGGLGPEETGV